MTSIYERNLELILRSNPAFKPFIESYNLSGTKEENWQWCETDKKEKNLKRDLQGHTYFLHSQNGAVSEIERWFVLNINTKCKAWFIFGLGLGYHYQVLKQWLRKDPSRFLVFLEDDVEILLKFLTLEQAFEILDDPQVIIRFFQLPKEDYSLFKKQFDGLISGFFHHAPSFQALDSYRITRSDIYQALTQMINLTWAELNMTYSAIVVHSFPEEFRNLYRNFPYTYMSYAFEKLYGLFAGIPMIMCGAGPSLEDNFDLLRTLEDKAIIVGGGSALNALSAHFILPHIGGAVDPTISQRSRFISNFAYETPIVYMWRFNAPAFQVIKGPKLFVKGIIGFPVSFWLESKLNMFTGLYKIDMGISSPTFLTTVLSRFGTKKIILCGIDLSYVNKKRYSKGIDAHPTDIVEEKQHIHNVHPDLVPAKNAKGEIVQTTLQMKYEASYYNEFSQLNPHIKIINTSLSGLEIFNIEHISLKDIPFEHSYDIAGRMHAAIQNAQLNLTFKEMKSTMDEWISSLENCKNITVNLLEKLRTLSIDEFVEKHPFDQEFGEEFIYKSLLYIYLAILEPDYLLDQYQADCHPEKFTKEQLDQKKRRYFESRLMYLKKATEWHIEHAKHGLFAYSENQNVLLTHTKKPFRQAPKKTLQKHDYPSIDPSQEAVEQVNTESGKWNGLYKVYYPSGALFGESTYVQGVLHGPSKFYDESKNLLSETIFVDGKREGESWLYYPSGDVYCINRFEKGIRHGEQEYYYPNGNLKTLLNYKKGVFEGTIRIFYVNGVREREINFKDGKLNGFEYGWNARETLIHESEYAMGRPINRSRVWNDNGNLIRQYTYYGDTGSYEFVELDQHGRIIRKKSHLADNALDRAREKSADLNKSIEELKAELERIKRERL